MTKLLFLIVTLLIATIPATAETDPRYPTYTFGPSQWTSQQPRRTYRARHYPRHVKRHQRTRYASRSSSRRYNSSTATLIGPLAAKVNEIASACGSRVISAHRPGARIAGGRGRLSLHASYPSRAADIAGNLGCIRGQLAGWPGGIITYGGHVHISYAPNGSEWGLNTRSGGRRGHRTYARRW